MISKLYYLFSEFTTHVVVYAIGEFRCLFISLEAWF